MNIHPRFCKKSRTLSFSLIFKLLNISLWFFSKKIINISLCFFTKIVIITWFFFKKIMNIRLFISEKLWAFCLWYFFQKLSTLLLFFQKIMYVTFHFLKIKREHYLANTIILEKIVKIRSWFCKSSWTLVLAFLNSEIHEY